MVQADLVPSGGPEPADGTAEVEAGPPSRLSALVTGERLGKFSATLGAVGLLEEHMNEV